MRVIVLTDYMTLNSGIASLHDRLAARINVRYGAPIAELVEGETGITGVLRADGQKSRADHTIVATPPGIAAKILPQSWEEERVFLSSIQHPPAIVVTLFLDSSLEDRIWSYVFRPDPGRIVSFCVDAAQKNPAMVPSGKSALQAWICHPASGCLLSLEDRAVVDAVINELSCTFDRLAEKLEHAHVHKVAHAIPQNGVGQNGKASEFLRLVDTRTGVDFCGDYLSGGYMECALWSAERAFRKLSPPKA